MRKGLVIIALIALALPATALAGGTATVGVTPPEGAVGAGDKWDARITVLQHGETPLDGVTPTLTIRNGSESRTFKGVPTGEPGVYTASVIFPSEGKWSYEVYDGFTEYGGAQTHTFKAVSVGTGGGASLPFFAIIGIPLIALALAAILFLLARRVRVRAPAPAS